MPYTGGWRTFNAIPESLTSFRFPLDRADGRRSRLPPVGDEVVEVEQVGPALDVAAVRAALGEILVEELPVLGRGAALVHRVAPHLDFPGRVAVALVRSDPCEEVAVALALRDFGLQRAGLNAEEGEDALVVRAGEVEGALRAGDFGAAFVEHAGKQRATAEAGANAARWTKGEVGDGDVHADIHRTGRAREASGSRRPDFHLKLLRNPTPCSRIPGDEESGEEMERGGEGFLRLVGASSHAAERFALIEKAPAAIALAIKRLVAGSFWLRVRSGGMTG